MLSSFKVGIFCAVIAAFLFGTISTIAKPTLSSISPLFLSACVYLVASASMTPLVRFRLPNVGKKAYGLILLSGIFGGTLAPFFYFYGLNNTTAVSTAVVSNSEIIFSILIAIFIFRSRLPRSSYLAMIMVFVGIFIVSTDLNFSTFVPEFNLGNTLILVSSVFWAIDNNLNRILTRYFTNSAIIAQLKSSIGGVTLLAISLVSQTSLDFDPVLLPNVIVLGAGGFAFALLFFLFSVRRIGTVNTLLIFSLFSPIGAISAWAILGESVSPYQILAISIMILGIYLVLRRQNQIIDQNAH